MDIVILDRCMGRAGAISAQNIDSISIILINVVVLNNCPIGSIVLDDDPTRSEVSRVILTIFVDLGVVDVGIRRPVRHNDTVSTVVVDTTIFHFV